MIKRYSPEEELANSLSHGIGILLGVVAGWFLLQKASANTGTMGIICVLVYLFGLLSSYITSTWYHASPPGKTKELLRKFDHAAIYLHIAGTYTPFTLLVLIDKGFWGWGIFGFVWIAALAGVILSFTNLKEHSHVETICFILMGGAIIVALKPLNESLASMDALPSFWWLIGGGVSYVVGAIFYSLRKVPFMHSVFHLFTLGGSICHLIAVWWVV